MELQAVTGQLYIVNGAPQEGAGGTPGLLAQVAPPKAARGRERDFLFVHLTLTGKPEETAVLTQDLLDAISQHYYRTTGSVTAALRGAITKANELLLRLNLSGTSVSREGAITGAVLRNGELFMLQTGEALALLGHNFGVERFPPQPPDHITPLGRSAGVDIRYTHRPLEPGDMLLLADPRIAHLPAHALAPALVDTEVELGLAQLRDIVASDSARLLLVEFTEDAPADLPDVTRPIKRPGQSVATLPPPMPRRQPDTIPAGITTSRRPQPERPSAAQPTHPPSRQRALPTEAMETTARQATAQAALGVARFTGWLAELLARLRPPRPAAEEPTHWALPALLAIIIPVVVAAIVSSVYLQRGRVRRFAEIKIEMGQHLALAEETGDNEVTARQQYQAVQVLADEAETLRPGDEEIARLRQQATTAVDQLDGVTRLAARPFYEYGETVNLTAVVLREGFNGGVYTLDGANGNVYQQETDESYLEPITAEPEPIIFSGQVLGNHIVGDVVDIMWRPRGSAVSREGLAMLDGSGALLTYHPNLADTLVVPLGLASEWQLPAAITSFDERLYVLDVGARQIWKYFPDGDGFFVDDNERVLFFSSDQNPDLGQAVDIAIYSEDGSLVVLYRDGRIRYYDTRSGRVQWDESYLLQNGLNTPLVAPTAVELVGSGLNASIFVADPGSGRLIQIARGGLVLAQYRANDESGRELFGRISDFAIVETPLRIFATAGATLYVATQE